MIFPGVGAFGHAVQVLREREYIEPLKKYIRDDRPFLGICIGFQALFYSSEESTSPDDVQMRGLEIIKGSVERFQEPHLAVPHMGWNQIRAPTRSSMLLSNLDKEDHLYFVHSYCVRPNVSSPLSSPHHFTRICRLRMRSGHSP